MTTIDRLRHPSISEAVTRAAGIDPEPIPSRGVTRWTAQARQDRPRPFGRTSGPRRLSGPFLADGGTVGDGSRVHPRVCGEAGGAHVWIKTSGIPAVRGSLVDPARLCARRVSGARVSTSPPYSETASLASICAASPRCPGCTPAMPGSLWSLLSSERRSPSAQNHSPSSETIASTRPCRPKMRALASVETSRAISRTLRSSPALPRTSGTGCEAPAGEPGRP